MYACAQSLGHRTVIQVSCTEMRCSYKYVDEAVPVLIWVMHSKVDQSSLTLGPSTADSGHVDKESLQSNNLCIFYTVSV
jgi:hypothetical protein